jgi:RNA polymerase sigma-70 factor (ECF subfamily)
MEYLEGLRLTFDSTSSARSQVDLSALVETYGALLFRIAHSILRSRTEAEDVVQEVFLRCLQRQAELDKIDSMRVWLVRIAWNAALDRRRRIRPDQLDPQFAQTLAARNVPADRALDQSRRITRVLAEIDRLPRPEREALLLSAIDELSTPELAQILHRSESAIRALLFRARARLRERLQAPAPPNPKGGPR